MEGEGIDAIDWPPSSPDLQTRMLVNTSGTLHILDHILYMVSPSSGERLLFQELSEAVAQTECNAVSVKQHRGGGASIEALLCCRLHIQLQVISRHNRHEFSFGTDIEWLGYGCSLTGVNVLTLITSLCVCACASLTHTHTHAGEAPPPVWTPAGVTTLRTSCSATEAPNQAEPRSRSAAIQGGHGGCS